MRVQLVTVAAAAVLAAGCGGPQAPAATSAAARSPAAPSAARRSPAFPGATASAPFTLAGVQACRELRADLARNHGVPDIPMLRRIADHVSVTRLAAYARTAVRDIDHTGAAPIALVLFRDECARAGVRIPER